MSTVELEPVPVLADGDDDRESREITDGDGGEKQVGISEAIYANIIAWSINEFALGTGLGFTFVEARIRLRADDRSRYQPDLIYLSSERWSRSRRVPTGEELLIVPDIAVEVVSPTNLAQEIEDKVVTYLEAGVRLVWIIYPSTERVYVHEALTAVRVVTRGGELDGGAVLPGFRLPMAELFPEPSE